MALPGVSDMEQGQPVSVFADVEGKCRRGLVKPFDGCKVFVGNGIALMSRKQLFAGSDKIQWVIIALVYLWSKFNLLKCSWGVKW